MAQGRFISFEGGDGAGKSTQIKSLAARLSKSGREIVLTREVGGCPSAEEIRELWLSKKAGFWDPMSEVLLVMAARREHLARTIWPALARGAFVLSDRFVDSTRVYQGIAQGVGVEVVDRVYEQIAPGFWPDKTILLDLPPAIGLARVAARRGQDDRFQQQPTAFHETIRQGFLDLASRAPDRFIIVDASVPPEEIEPQLTKIANDLLAKG